MTPNEYQELACETAPQTYKDFDNLTPSQYHIIHAQMGVASECGELADAVKKRMIYGQPLDFDNVKEECGDLMWYIALMLSACGFTIEEAMQENIAKLKIRYPEKFTEELAKQRLDKQ